MVASSHTIGTETVPERWRGLMSGAVGGGGSAVGGLLASLVFYVVTLIAPGDEFAAWGWRLMFFSGLLTSVIGLFLFRNLEEVALLQGARDKEGRATADRPAGCAGREIPAEDAVLGTVPARSSLSTCS